MLPVERSLDDQLRPCLGHCRKQAVRIDAPQRLGIFSESQRGRGPVDVIARSGGPLHDADEENRQRKRNGNPPADTTWRRDRGRVTVICNGASEALEPPGEEGVVEKRNTEHDREKIEEPVISGGRNQRLQEDKLPECQPPEPAGAEEKEWDDQLDVKCDPPRKAANRFRKLMRIPTRPCRQGLRPVVVIEGRPIAP